jgi:hypothetical protein
MDVFAVIMLIRAISINRKSSTGEIKAANSGVVISIDREDDMLSGMKAHIII